MPALTPEVKETYLAVWNEETNTLETYTGEDADSYLDPEYRWEMGFTIPHAQAVSQMMDGFINGCIPKAIPDWACLTPIPIDNILRPVFNLRMIEVAVKELEPKKKLFLVKVLQVHATSEFVEEAMKEIKEAEIKNKILGGTPAGMPQGVPQGAMQVTPEQLQQMLASGMIRPVGAAPMQPPQPKPSGIILK